mgnify:CR=1 FL=1
MVYLTDFLGQHFVHLPRRKASIRQLQLAEVAMAVASSSLILLQHVRSDGFAIAAPPPRLLRPYAFAKHRTCIFSLPSASFRPLSPSLSVYAFQPIDSQEGKTKGSFWIISWFLSVPRTPSSLIVWFSSPLQVRSFCTNLSTVRVL